MGKSKSIDQQAKQNKEFQVFLDELALQIPPKLEKIQENVNDQTKRFYATKEWDSAPFLEFSYSDYQTTSTWSLDNVVSIVKNIGDAITGKTKPDSIDNNAEPSNKTIEAIEQEQTGITANIENIQDTVISLIGGIMQSFTTVNEITSTNIVRSVPLGYGMHLFFGINVNIYSDNRFFESQFIQEYIMFYKVQFSLQEAQNLLKIQIVESLSKEIESNLRLKNSNREVYEKNARIAIENADMAAYRAADDFREMVNQKLDDSTEGFKQQITNLEEQIRIDETIRVVLENISKDNVLNTIHSMFYDEQLSYALKDKRLELLALN